MFTTSRSKHSTDSFSKSSRVGKTSSKQKRSFKDHASTSRRAADIDLKSSAKYHPPPHTAPSPGTLTSAIITLSIGPPSTARLFAAHEDVLTTSPYFRSALHAAFYASPTPGSPSSPGAPKQLALPTESPEVFSCILEYLYKGDYSPRLEYDRRRGAWVLEPTTGPAADPTVWLPLPSSSQPQETPPSSADLVPILKDTAVYCAAQRYDLPALQRLALRKQGLHAGIPVATILASARFAYANTPESDSRLRGHYLQLIIRSRGTFKRSGTMQACMGRGDGSGLWFDLFVALCNHLDDLEELAKSPRKT